MITLRTVEHTAPDSRHALVAPSTAARFLGGGAQGPLLLELAAGSDCVLSALSSPEVPEGCVMLTEAQQHNVHLKTGCTGAFRQFPHAAAAALTEVEVEASFVSGAAGAACTPLLDATHLAHRFARAYLGHVVSVNQACLFGIEQGGGGGGGGELLLRVSACESLEEESRAEAVGYHCYRGLVTPETEVFVRALGSEAGGADAVQPEGTLTRRGRVLLSNLKPRPPPGRPANVVHVLTNDGECFPVKSRLLRPCIALTGAVRRAGGGAEVQTPNVDTLTFDRVLIFLEAEALGREPPRVGIHLIPQLQAAARALGLASLAEHCAGALGASAARRRFHSWAELVARNAGGECLLVMDGMVFDVTRWLPEHPGGSTIIPAQALNVDSSRFFEVYHASRESFLYLRDFYVGEVAEEDLDEVPRPEEEPSPEFLEQLRRHTAGFRLPRGSGGGEERTHKSF